MDRRHMVHRTAHPTVELLPPSQPAGEDADTHKQAAHQPSGLAGCRQLEAGPLTHCPVSTLRGDTYHPVLVVDCGSGLVEVGMSCRTEARPTHTAALAYAFGGALARLISSIHSTASQTLLPGPPIHTHTASQPPPPSNQP